LLIVGAAEFSSRVIVLGTVCYAFVPFERPYHRGGGSRVVSIATRPPSSQGRGRGAKMIAPVSNTTAPSLTEPKRNTRKGSLGELKLVEPKLGEPKANLDRSDRTVALQALQMALTELGDGVTLVCGAGRSASSPAASSPSPRSATIWGVSAARSSIRCRGAGTRERSKALPAAG